MDIRNRECIEVSKVKGTNSHADESSHASAPEPPETSYCHGRSLQPLLFRRSYNSSIRRNSRFVVLPGGDPQALKDCIGGARRGFAPVFGFFHCRVLCLLVDCLGGRKTLSYPRLSVSRPSARSSRVAEYATREF